MIINNRQQICVYAYVYVCFMALGFVESFLFTCRCTVVYPTIASLLVVAFPRQRYAFAVRLPFFYPHHLYIKDEGPSQLLWYRQQYSVILVVVCCCCCYRRYCCRRRRCCCCCRRLCRLFITMFLYYLKGQEPVSQPLLLLLLCRTTTPPLVCPPKTTVPFARFIRSTHTQEKETLAAATTAPAPPLICRQDTPLPEEPRAAGEGVRLPSGVAMLALSLVLDLDLVLVLVLASDLVLIVPRTRASGAPREERGGGSWK